MIDPVEVDYDLAEPTVSAELAKVLARMIRADRSHRQPSATDAELGTDHDTTPT